MKASVKLGEDPRAPPLVRAKLPVAFLGLPFVVGATAAAPRDLSFQLRTAFPAGPSLRLSYHPHLAHPFSLTLRSGVGLWGSPRRSPLLLTAHLPLGPAVGPALSFSIQICPSLGDFSLKGRAAAVSTPPNPSPAVPKENGGAVHQPLQSAEAAAARGLGDEDLASVTAVTVRTTLPVAGRAAVTLRWAVRLPRAAGGGGAPVGKGLPFLAVDKIGIGSLGEEGGGGKEKGVARAVEVGEGEAEALKGMLFWMRREVEELQREHGSIKESLEELRRAAPAPAGKDRSGAVAPRNPVQPSRGV